MRPDFGDSIVCQAVFARLLLLPIALFVAGPAHADAVIRTQAMLASTIAELAEGAAELLLPPPGLLVVR